MPHCSVVASDSVELIEDFSESVQVELSESLFSLKCVHVKSVENLGLEVVPQISIDLVEKWQTTSWMKA